MTCRLQYQPTDTFFPVSLFTCLASLFLFRFLGMCLSGAGGGSVRGCPALRCRAGGASVRNERAVGATAVLHLRFLAVGDDHPDGYLRRDQYRHVLFPALLGRLPLVRMSYSIQESFFVIM